MTNADWDRVLTLRQRAHQGEHLSDRELSFLTLAVSFDRKRWRQMDSKIVPPARKRVRGRKRVA